MGLRHIWRSLICQLPQLSEWPRKFMLLKTNVLKVTEVAPQDVRMHILALNLVQPNFHPHLLAPHSLRPIFHLQLVTRTAFAFNYFLSIQFLFGWCSCPSYCPDDLELQIGRFQLFRKVCPSVMGHSAGSPALLTAALRIQKLKDQRSWPSDRVGPSDLPVPPQSILQASSSLHARLSPPSACNIPQYNLFHWFLLLSRDEGCAQHWAPLEGQRAGPFELWLDFNSAPFLPPSASL